MKILIVDDSVVFRSQIKAVVEGISQITEISLASNGKLALQKLETGQFDIMTLDMEMPEMNGLETLRALKGLAHCPAVIVFSSVTSRGAEATIQAMELGALDFSPKPAQAMNLEEAQKLIRQDLAPKIIQVCQKLQRQRASPITAERAASNPIAYLPEQVSLQFESSKQWSKINLDFFRPAAIVIGSSTGGPSALKSVLRCVRNPLQAPIFITQHMPPLFTKSLADNLSSQLGIPVDEGKHLEVVQANKIYIAPGDYHMSLKNRGDQVTIVLDQREKRNSVRPAVDYLFESAAEIYGPKLLGIVLTGMGQDGLIGCKAIKDHKGAVVIQDEASSTVWGMPGSVFKHGAFDKMCSLEDLEVVLGHQLGRAA